MPSPDEDQIVVMVGDIIERLRELTRAPDAKLTCNMLIEMIGSRSYALAIFVFSLLNLLPAPPGYNFVMGLIITAFSVMLALDRPIRLGPYLGHMKLPIKAINGLLGALAKITDLVAKVSSPRWVALTGRTGSRVVALVAIVLGVSMLVPIPFTNMLPSIGLAMISVGLLNRDGLLLVLGALVGIVGAVIAFVAVWAIVALIFVVEDAIDG